MTSFALTDRSRRGMGIALRTVAAIVGGYALAAAATALLAALLPLVSTMQRIDATIVATMLSFAIYAGAVLWTFSRRDAWRPMLALTAILSGALAGLLWLQGTVA